MKFLVVILGVCLTSTVTEACTPEIQAAIMACLDELGFGALMNSGGRINGLLPPNLGYGDTAEEQLENLGEDPRSLNISGPDAFSDCLNRKLAGSGNLSPESQELQHQLCTICTAGIANSNGWQSGSSFDTGILEENFDLCEEIHIHDDPMIAQFIDGEEKGRQTCYLMSGQTGEIYTLFEEEWRGGFRINVQLEKWSLDSDPRAKYVGILSVTEGYFVMTVDLAGLSFIGSSKGMDSMILPWGQHTFTNLTENVYVDLRRDTMEIQFGNHLSIEVIRRHGEFLNVALDHDDPFFKNVKGVLGDVAHFTKIVPDTKKGKGEAIEVTDPVTGATSSSHTSWIGHAGCNRVSDSSAMDPIVLANKKPCLFC